MIGLRKELKGGGGSCWRSHMFSTADRKGSLSTKVFTSLLLMAEDFNGERAAAEEADNCIQHFHSTIFLTVKFNSWPDCLFSNSLFFGTQRWKTLLFLSDGQRGKKWHYHLLWHKSSQYQIEFQPVEQSYIPNSVAGKLCCRRTCQTMLAAHSVMGSRTFLFLDLSYCSDYSVN